MAIVGFPPLSHASPEGLLAVGGDLEPESLILAYGSGIFPWPMEGLGLTWFSPAPRTIMRAENFRLSRSFKKHMKHTQYAVSVDACFSEVMQACADQSRPDQDGTWITEEMLSAYALFHQLGYAHSVEIWQDQQLTGGIYGIYINGVFSAESMFYKKSNASRLAIFHLLEYLSFHEIHWIDIQVMTPHMERWGASTMQRDLFIGGLERGYQGNNPPF